jgi:RNA polymerase II-associated protein 2
MTTQLPARSILKQPSAQPSPTDEQKAKAERDRRNLGIALHHANKIQERKDIEARIFGNIETLLEFPSAVPFSPSDASRYVSLIRLFQPGDFDNLIEERRIDGKCGYALCSNPPRSKTVGMNSAWKLQGKGATDYCSSDCLRKSLYLKTQLSEAPAWEREANQHPNIVLHADDRPSNISSPTTPRRSGAQTNHHELALERGETATSLRPNQVMVSNVVEKAKVAQPRQEVVRAQGTSHAAIEGYEPTSTSSSRTRPKDQSNGIDHQLSFDRRNDEEMAEEDSWRDLFDSIEKS